MSSTRYTHNALGQAVGLPLADTSPRSRPPRTPMQGRYCRIEPLDVDAHGVALYQAFALAVDERDWTYLPYGPFAGEAAFLSWLEAHGQDRDPLFHTLINEQGEIAGLASFLRIAPDAASIEVGHIHLGPALQRSRAGTEAMYLMMRRVFDELGYRRYEWKCDALNERSRRAACRYGFSFEGIFRQATHYKGRNRDTAWYALIDRDWPEVKVAFERWLDPDNFDGAGRQCSGLMASKTP